MIGFIAFLDLLGLYKCFSLANLLVFLELFLLVDHFLPFRGEICIRVSLFVTAHVQFRSALVGFMDLLLPWYS